MQNLALGHQHPLAKRLGSISASELSSVRAATASIMVCIIQVLTVGLTWLLFLLTVCYDKLGVSVTVTDIWWSCSSLVICRLLNGMCYGGRDSRWTDSLSNTSAASCCCGSGPSPSPASSCPAPTPPHATSSCCCSWGACFLLILCLV